MPGDRDAPVPPEVGAGDDGVAVAIDLQVLERRVMAKDDPADPVGDYAIGGTVASFGATLGVAF